MGLFDFFKKILEKKNETSEVEQEKISFSEIGNWVERKRKEIEIREKDILVLIQEKINVFINELKGKMTRVESADVESKKVEDRIKFIANEGRKKYIESANDFLESLDSLEKGRLEKFIEEINKIFLDFNKNSHMSYERATILIGKEMAEVKKSLKIFSGDLIKIFNENKDVVDSLKKFSVIELELKNITETNETFGKIDEVIISLDKKVTEKKEENEKILEEIEEIKKSEDYVKNLERQGNIKLLEGELDKSILGLKQIINFKVLTNFFHIFEKQMKVVKLHRDDFQTGFRKDDGESIVKLLDEAKLNNEMISKKIKHIKERKEEKEKEKQEIKKDNLEELYSATTKIILDIGNLNNEKERDEKRREKLKIRKEELVEDVKEEVEGIGGVEVF
jgi:hypothetical protein